MTTNLKVVFEKMNTLDSKRSRGLWGEYPTASGFSIKSEDGLVASIMNVNQHNKEKRNKAISNAEFIAFSTDLIGAFREAMELLEKVYYEAGGINSGVTIQELLRTYGIGETK